LLAKNLVKAQKRIQRFFKFFAFDFQKARLLLYLLSFLPLGKLVLSIDCGILASIDVIF
jgi:hypothetical protein